MALPIGAGGSILQLPTALSSICISVPEPDRPLPGDLQHAHLPGRGVLRAGIQVGQCHGGREARCPLQRE